MKPTKMRNIMIYRATYHTKSKQLGSALSKDLQKKYGKKSVRISQGDSITIVRGEFKGVDGKVSKVSTQKNSVAIEGIKKEKTKGDKFDVYIHTSNLMVTSLNSEDKWRIAKLEGKDPRKMPKTPAVKKETDSTKVAKEGEDKVEKTDLVSEKETEKAEMAKEDKETTAPPPKETKEVKETKEKEDKA